LSGPPSPGRIEVPAEVVGIVRRLEAAGFESWTVGGAVRDALAGGHPLDWDLATAARPGDVQRIFPRTVPVGIAHGTVGVLGKSGHLHEVTTFRRDVETDGRHARVVFARTLEEDLARRDFTINAVAWHPIAGELRDPQGGVADLAAGRLRTVGEATERFREDRLRALRAFRFAGRFDLRIDPATWDAARAVAPELGALSSERVREELLKVLRQVRPPSRSLVLYARSGALASLYPEVAAAPPEAWEAALRTVDLLPPHRPLLLVAALVAVAGAGGADRIVRRLRFSNADADRIVHLVAQASSFPPEDAAPPGLRRWLRRVGRGYLADLLRLRGARLRAAGDAAALAATARTARRLRAELAAGAALEIGDLAIGGAELRGLGIRPGPLFGEILRELLERVTDEPALNERERLLKVVRERIAAG
jgi:tRNA nucleotidyltransferase (CCA-adding enzyme)